MKYFKVHCNFARVLIVRHTFNSSVVDIGGVLLLAERTKTNNPSIKCVTEDEVGSLLSVERNKQLLT